MDFKTLSQDVGYCYMVGHDLHEIDGVNYRFAIRADDDPQHDEGVMLTQFGLVPAPTSMSYAGLTFLHYPMDTDFEDVYDDGLSSPYWWEAIREYQIPIAQKAVGAPSIVDDLRLDLDVELTEGEFWDELPQNLEVAYSDVDRGELTIRGDLQQQINRIGHTGWDFLKVYGAVLDDRSPVLTNGDDVPEIYMLGNVPAGELPRDPDFEFNVREAKRNDKDPQTVFENRVSDLVDEHGPVKVGATDFDLTTPPSTPSEVGVWTNRL